MQNILTNISSLYPGAKQAPTSADVIEPQNDLKGPAIIEFPSSSDIEHIQTRPSSSQSTNSSAWGESMKKRMSEA